MSTPQPGSTRPGLVLTICCLSMLVAIMDISIVNVALPDIRRDFDTSVTGLQWTIDAYTLVLGGFLVLAGSMADRLGRRRVFQIGLIAFGLGSLACGLAPGIGWLVAARVLQALGGTMLNPVALAIVASVYPTPAERARAVGIFGAMSGLALTLGPIVGGAVVDSVGWRFVFFVNVPIIVAAVAGTTAFVPESRAARARRFDPVGQVLMLVVLAAGVFAIIESERIGWGSPLILTLLGVTVLGVAGLALYEPRRRDPLLDLRLFRSVPFSAAIGIAVLGLWGFGMFLFVTTQYLQDVRGQSALSAGLSLLPVGVLVCVLSPLAGRSMGRHGPRPALLLAGTALAVGGVTSLFLTPSTSLVIVLVVFLPFGVFTGMVNPPITATAVEGMPRSMTAVAGSLASVGRQTGTSLGVALAGAVIGSSATAGGTDFTDSARTVWWLTMGLGSAIVALAVASSGPRARESARRAAALFESVESTPAHSSRRVNPDGRPEDVPSCART